MKVGIITLTDVANYGQKLQNYALIHVLEKMNISAYTINHSQHNNDIAYKFYNKLKHTILFLLKDNRPARKRILKFNKFINKYLNVTSKTINKIDCQDYDFFVCGSDQIWNLNFESVAYNWEIYFAQFAPEYKRIAFSASLGTNNIPEKYISKFVNGIKGMEAISVREDDSVQLIKDLTGREVICTADPTLLLKSCEWEKIASKPKSINKNDKYILTYFLGEESNDIVQFINRISSNNKLKIIKLFDDKNCSNKLTKYEEDYFSFSPDEFIWLVKNCEIMITDSFHGCVFSALFKKPFRWFSRNQKNMNNMDSRMYTLFKKLEIRDWCIGNCDEEIKNVFYSDYSNLENNLEIERKIATNYLKHSLFDR